MILWFLAGVALLAALLALKLRRDTVRQGGRRVGSALGWAVTADGAHAYFPIVRGEPAFLDDQAFEYKGRSFLIVGYDGVDARSPVLRRFLGVTCWMVPAGEALKGGDRGA